MENSNTIEAIAAVYTEDVLADLLKAFKKLDDLSKRNVSSSVVFEKAPFPVCNVEGFLDDKNNSINVKKMRVFCNQFSDGMVSSVENVVIDIQQRPLRVFIDLHSMNLGLAVYAAYHACCIALLSQELHTYIYSNGIFVRKTQEEYITESYIITRTKLLQSGFPHLELLSVSEGAADFMYWEKCKLNSMLYQFNQSDLRFVRKMLAAELSESSDNSDDYIILQAVEELKQICYEQSSLCAVPFNDGMHSLLAPSYSRIRFACIDPDLFLQEFHPITNFDDVFGQSYMNLDDYSYDGYTEQISELRYSLRHFDLPESVTLITVGEDFFPRLLGTDITCLSENEKHMMLAEIVLVKALDLLGNKVKAVFTDGDRLSSDIHYQLSAFYCSLKGHRNSENLLIFN